MSFMMSKKEFKVVALKGSGEYVNYSQEVPLLAQRLLSRSNEITHSTGTEIALYEPKKSGEHKIGHYYAGLVVSQKFNEVPPEMEYIEIAKNYISARGNILMLNELHSQLLIWADEQGYQRDLNAYIIETYHPVGGGEEEVEIHLPIL
ncbi:GyrI-like domain-containing protein [Bacillus mesophilum]|uniref:AraC family transcriptional regulator n=1 Tax=Bacillus mesophilum TaxID=1071718 RepID=A0A7V7RNF6_9BACI|nr:GyrI-like domain-containing protein [Bacillus mesophilum]KAB2333964.1 AraC family transcriptional regulator [Bacillus mesophilum]